MAGKPKPEEHDFLKPLAAAISGVLIKMLQSDELHRNVRLIVYQEMQRIMQMPWFEKCIDHIVAKHLRNLNESDRGGPDAN